MNLKTLKIKTRLLIGFGAIMLIFLFSGIITSYLLIKADNSAKIIRDKSLPYAMIAKDIGFQIVQVQQFFTDMSATHDTEVYTEAENAANNFRKDIEKFKKLYRTEKNGFYICNTRYRTRESPDEEF